MLNSAQREYINKNKHRMTPAEIGQVLKIKPSRVREALKELTENPDQKISGVVGSRSANPRAIIISLAILVGLIIAGYYPSLHNQYAFDDISSVENNDFIRSLKNIKGLVTHEYFAGSGELSYRPLVTLTYFIDYALFKDNPAGYHLHNMIWHILVTVLLYFTALRLKFSWPLALFASGIFAVHPANAEAVNSIAFREDLLCTFFYLAAFLTYLKCITMTRSPLWRIAVLFGSVFLSLCSKEMGMSFIGVAFLYYFTFQGAPGARSLKTFIVRADTVAVITATVIFGTLRFLFFNNNHAELVEYIGGFLPNLLSVVANYAKFFRIMIWPQPLSIVYLIHPISSVLDIRFITAFFVLILIAYAAWRMKSSKPLGFYLIVAIFFMLLPVSNLIPIRHPVAERYLYLPNALFCLLITGFVSGLRVMEKKHKYIYVSFFGALVALMLVRTHFRAYDWYDNFSLWGKAVKIAPLSSKAHYSLGHAWQTIKNNMPRAIEEYEIAKQLDPQDSWICINLGMAYKDVGEYQKAEAEFLEGLKIDPKSGLLYYDLGILYGKMEDRGREEDAYRSAISLDKTYVDAYDNLAVLLAQKGDEAAARELWEKAVKINSKHVRSIYNLGNYYANHGDISKAVTFWQHVLELDPTHQGARERLEK